MTRERITISSTDIQRGWRTVQAHLIRGHDVVVEHYNVPVAIITAYPADPAEWLSPEEEDPAPERFTTDVDAKNDILNALSNSEGSWDEDAIDAIFREAYEWKIDVNDRGQELLNTAGFEQVVDADEFWEIVARHDRDAVEPGDDDPTH